MLYLLDSDVARKLAQYNLVGELICALNCDKTNLAVLPQLKYQLGLTLQDKSKALKKLGSQEAVLEAENLLAYAVEVEVVADVANPILDLNSPDFDSGEKTLLAAIASQPHDELISGDKRALIAISKIHDIPALADIWLRILCLEEAIFVILGVNPFEDVSNKVRARPDVDITLSIAFGKGMKKNYESVIEALTSYMKNLNVETSGHYCLPSSIG